MVDVYRESSIVCLPSYREGLPKVLLEAGASGRPVVATDVPGCREVVRHGENGILVRSRDGSSLADALQRLLTDAGLRARMGQRGRVLVERWFTSDRVARETLDLYDKLLNRASMEIA